MPPRPSDGLWQAHLGLQTQISSEYILRELGLERSEERADRATLALFGRLCRMPEGRLAGHIFRARCNQVDAGQAPGSWCAHVKQLLDREPGFHSVWAQRSPLRRWKSRVRQACSGYYTARSEAEIAARSLGSLEAFARLGPSQTGNLLRTSMRDKGNRFRFRLRAGGVPLFWNVAASRPDLEDIEPENRWCRRCMEHKIREADTAQHFLCSCLQSEHARNLCLARISGAIDGLEAPQLLVGSTL